LSYDGFALSGAGESTKTYSVRSTLTYLFLYFSILIFLRIDNAEVRFRYISHGMNLLLPAVLLAFAVSEDYSVCSKQNKAGRRNCVEFQDVLQAMHVRVHEKSSAFDYRRFTEFLLRPVLTSHSFLSHSLFIPIFRSLKIFVSLPFCCFDAAFSFSFNALFPVLLHFTFHIFPPYFPFQFFSVFPLVL